MKRLKPIFFELLLLLIITVPAFAILLNQTYPSIHDDQHIARLYLLDAGLRQASVYPRWVDTLGFGFGYPLYNFYPPLTYYVAEVFHLIGFNFFWSVKLMVIAGFALASIGMYYLTKPYIGKAAGLLASVLYTYFTYHAVVAYVRGAFAELFAMAILPFLLACLFKIHRDPKLNNALWFGLLLGLIILTHPLIAFPSVLFIVLLTIILLIANKGKRLIFVLWTLFGSMLGFGLSAFFWLPSLVEKKHTLVDSILTSELASYKIHFVYPHQFWYSPWGYGGSGEGPFDGLSFQLGKIHIILTLISLVLSIIYVYVVLKKKMPWVKKFPAINFYYVSFCFVLISLFMSTNYSRFVWDATEFLWYLQFPWRFLTFAALFISICGAFSIYFVTHIFEKINTKKILFIMTLCISTLTIFQYQKYFRPQKQLITTDELRTSREEIAWRVSRTSYEFVPKGVKTTKTKLGTTIVDIEKDELPKKPYEVIEGSGNVIMIKNHFAYKVFTVSSQSPTTLQLNTYNFPGWTAYLDKEKALINDNNKFKLITINIPSGEHIVEFRFENTPIRTFGNLISLTTLTILVIYFAKRKFASTNAV